MSRRSWVCQTEALYRDELHPCGRTLPTTSPGGLTLKSANKQMETPGEVNKLRSHKRFTQCQKPTQIRIRNNRLTICIERALILLLEAFGKYDGCNGEYWETKR